MLGVLKFEITKIVNVGKYITNEKRTNHPITALVGANEKPPSQPPNTITTSILMAIIQVNWTLVSQFPLSHFPPSLSHKKKKKLLGQIAPVSYRPNVPSITKQW